MVYLSTSEGKLENQITAESIRPFPLKGYYKNGNFYLRPLQERVLKGGQTLKELQGVSSPMCRHTSLSGFDELSSWLFLSFKSPSLIDCKLTEIDSFD